MLLNYANSEWLRSSKYTDVRCAEIRNAQPKAGVNVNFDTLRVKENNCDHNAQHCEIKYWFMSDTEKSCLKGDEQCNNRFM